MRACTCYTAGRSRLRQFSTPKALSKEGELTNSPVALHHTEATHAIITLPVILLLSAQLRQVSSRVSPSLTLTCLLLCSPPSRPTSILIESQNHLLCLHAANEQTVVGTDATETTNVIKESGWKRSGEFGGGGTWQWWRKR